MKKIYIKGAGDLATGIACRLYESGFIVVMAELAVPTTVRRGAAFSPAVYNKEAVVEGKRARFCEDPHTMIEALYRKEIPIIINNDGGFFETYRPDVVVDAIVAKKNLGTSKKDADFVIGIGPGFHAGEDCHCVIESMRGHDLGKCIYMGEASVNTGIPGSIGGFTTERIIRATAEGVFRGEVNIGDDVHPGQIVAFVDHIPVKAAIDGMVRGLLQDGVQVHKQMKVGDIDPRGNRDHCFTISDKARAIGGGVLEAIMHHFATHKVF